MTLTVKSLEFRDFRNYARFHLEDIGEATVFVGDNAVGKTNIIEGIQLVSAMQSFRHPPLEHLIREGCQNSFVTCNVGDESRSLEISLYVEKGKRQYRQNGKVKSASNLQGLMPSVTFTPDDLDLVKGPNTKRRNLLDMLGCQVSKNYSAVKRDFELTLKQKNALLKDEAPIDYLESVDEIFITCSAQLSCYRHALMKRIFPYLKDIYGRISSNGEEILGACYSPSWDRGDCEEEPACARDVGSQVLERDYAREQLRLALARRRGEEIARKHAVVGAHADHIDFFLQGRNAAQFGSQGQQRSIVLSWKLAEVALIEEMLGQRPILLLDDVMSELDGNRRQCLTEEVRKSTQVFITTANLQYFEDSYFSHARLVRLPIGAEG